MRTIHTPFLISSLVAAIPFEAFGVLVEKVIVNCTVALFVPVIPSAAIPIDFELAWILLVCLSLAALCIYKPS